MTVSWESIVSYHDLKEKGIVNAQEFEVMKYLFAVEVDQTNLEIAHATGLDINVVTARVNSLKKKRVNGQYLLIKCKSRINPKSNKPNSTVKANQGIFSNLIFDPQHATQVGVFDNG